MSLRPVHQLGNPVRKSELTSLLMVILPPMSRSRSNVPFSGSARFLLPVVGTEKLPPPRPLTRSARLETVTLPPDRSTSCNTRRIFQDSKVTSLETILDESRTQLSQMPHVVILPPDAARASALSQAAAESWVLAEKYYQVSFRTDRLVVDTLANATLRQVLRS